MALLVALVGMIHPIQAQAKEEPKLLLAQTAIQATIETPHTVPEPLPVIPAPKPTPKKQPIKVQPKKKATKVYGPYSGYACSCYMYAATKTGKNIMGYGLAKNIPVNSHTPTIGSIVVMYGGSTGHAAIVMGIDNGYLVLDEANHTRCKITQGRRVPMNSSSIKGYVN